MATVYEIIEKSRKTGKIEKGANEATKAAERGTAKLVVYAANVDPKQIVQHLPIICKEKNILCVEADDKAKLGLAAGIGVGCSALAVIELGDAEKDFAAFKTKNK
jgi:large subunit ribosomal protein L7Ae